MVFTISVCLIRVERCPLRHDLPSFKLFPYGTGLGNEERSVPALWVVSDCFSNAVHVDGHDKTLHSYMLWFQSRWSSDDKTRKAQWVIADREQDRNKVIQGAFLIVSAGVGIRLQ